MNNPFKIKVSSLKFLFQASISLFIELFLLFNIFCLDSFLNS